MIWWFFDRGGYRLFSRSDAIEFEHYVDTMSFKGSFPNSGLVPNAGALIGWQDDDDLWEVHEVSSITYDAFGDDFEIEGSHIAVTELGTIITDKCKLDNVTAKKALETIIGKQTQWQLGTLPAAADDDPIRKQRYRVTKKVAMYAEKNSKSKKLSTYKKGKYLTAVDLSDDNWWQMEGSDGRIGYIGNPSGCVVRDGNAGDEDRKVTCDEKFVSLWDLLTTVQDSTGWIISPRVTVDNTGITGRHIDLRTDEPDFHGVRLSCSTNISDGTIKYDVSELYTALYGVGKDNKTFKDVVWTKAAGYPVDKPKGQMYVASEEALELYGHDGIHRFGVVNFDDEENASELLSKTYDALQVYSAPKITIEGTIADLYKLGYGGESMRLYDKVYCILNPIGRRLELRITQLTRDLVKPEKTKPTIGSIDDTDLIATTVKATAQSVGIKSWQLGSGSVGNDALNSGSVTADKIAAGAVVADAISAQAVTTEKLAAGAVTADTIGVGAVTADKINATDISAQSATLTDLQAAIAKVTAAYIQKLESGSITSDELAAQLLRVSGYATIDNLVADGADINSLIVKDTTATKVFIKQLQLLSAQMARATVGELVIKASDGKYYKLDVTNGAMSYTEVTLTDDEITAGVTSDGRSSIIETSLTVDDLAAGNLKAINALIDHITADRLDVDTLMARQAFINALYTSNIYGGKSLKLLTFHDSSVPPTASEVYEGYRWLDTGVEPNLMRTWKGTAATPSGATNDPSRTYSESVDGTYSSEKSSYAITLDNAKGQITSDVTLSFEESGSTMSLVVINGTSYTVTLTDGIGSMAFTPEVDTTYTIYSSTPANASYTCSGWETINDTTDVKKTVEAHTVDLTDINSCFVIDEHGIPHIQQANNPSNQLVLTSGSVDIKRGDTTYSQFAANYVRFMDYQMYRTSDNGIAFKSRW